MCAPFSQADQVEPAITSLDLADSVEHLCLMAQDYGEVVRKVAIDDATSAQLGPRGSQAANMVRLRFEEAMIAFRATCRNALAGTTGTYCSETDLADAQGRRILQNDRNINRTAMRRTDEIEAAEQALMARGRERVDAVAASLPPYDAGAVAPCADLARATEGYSYGKCGAPASSHGDYERSFGSLSAA